MRNEPRRPATRAPRKSGSGVLRAGQQVAEADPRQGGVRQGVAQQALAAQQGEAAEHPSEGAEHRRPEEDVPGREAQLHVFPPGVRAARQRPLLEQRLGRLGQHGQPPAVGALEVLGREGGGHRARRHQPHVEQHHVVEVLGHGLEVVVHGHHRAAGVAQLLEQGEDGALGGGVDPGERLVHEVEPGVLGQGAGEEDPLLLAARELADLAVREILHAHLLQAGEGGLPVVRATAGGTSRCGRRAPWSPRRGRWWGSPSRRSRAAARSPPRSGVWRRVRRRSAPSRSPGGRARAWP